MPARRRCSGARTRWSAPAQVVSAVNRIGLENQPYACATVGMMQVQPELAQHDPGQGLLHRRPPPSRRRRCCRRWAASARRLPRRSPASAGLELDFKEIWYSPPVKFDADCVAAVQQAPRSSATANRRIISGAGHDAVYMTPGGADRA